MTLLQEYKAFRKDHKPKSYVYKDRTWEYLIGGKGQKTIVVLHGGGTSADGVWEYIRALEEDYRVIAPSLPAGIHAMEEVLPAIEGLLTKEEVKKTHILGFSLGGMIAQCFIRAYPDVVEDQILFVAMPPDLAFAPKLGGYLMTLRVVPRFLVRYFAKRFLKKQILREKSPEKEQDFWVTFLTAAIDDTRMNKAGVIDTLRLLYDYLKTYTFSPGDLKNHAGRTFIIEGAEDQLIGAEAREALKNLYPTAEVLTIPDSGHFAFCVLEVKPLVDRMGRFLSGHGLVKPAKYEGISSNSNNE